jgi:hypothetical protein
MSWTVFKRKKKEDAFDPGLWIVDAKGNTIVDTGALDVYPLSDQHKAMIEALPEAFEALHSSLRIAEAWMKDAAPSKEWEDVKNNPEYAAAKQQVDMLREVISKTEGRP